MGVLISEQRKIMEHVGLHPNRLQHHKEPEYLACILKAQVLLAITALHFHDTTSIHVIHVPGGVQAVVSSVKGTQ